MDYGRDKAGRPVKQPDFDDLSEGLKRYRSLREEMKMMMDRSREAEVGLIVDALALMTARANRTFSVEHLDYQFAGGLTVQPSFYLKDDGGSITRIRTSIFDASRHVWHYKKPGGSDHVPLTPVSGPGTDFSQQHLEDVMLAQEALGWDNIQVLIQMEHDFEDFLFDRPRRAFRIGAYRRVIVVEDVRVRYVVAT